MCGRLGKTFNELFSIPLHSRPTKGEFRSADPKGPNLYPNKEGANYKSIDQIPKPFSSMKGMEKNVPPWLSAGQRIPPVGHEKVEAELIQGPGSASAVLSPPSTDRTA